MSASARCVNFAFLRLVLSPGTPRMTAPPHLTLNVFYSTSNVKKRIRQARNSTKLDQEQFAEMLQVTVQTVSRWESGKMFPRVPQLEKIAKICNKPVYWFFTSDELQAQSNNDEGIIALCGWYKSLNPTGKAKLLSYASDLNDLVKYH